MIAWMLFAAAVAALAGLAGLAAERALRHARLATRWAWMGSIAASLLLLVPLARREDAGHTRVIPISTLVPAVRALPALGPASPAAPRPAMAPPLERALPAAWGAASAVLAAALAAGAWTLRRRTRRWTRAVVSGAPVLVSDATGPAVVGVFAPEIVLPRWTLSLPEPLRRLIVRHEREHVDADDPWLVLLAAAAVVLMPWSPALWWQLGRLRLAVEVDCDARVLRHGADARAYGEALIEVGRHAGRSRLAMAAFSEPTSSLERRIRIMTAPADRSSRVRALAFGALGAALLAAACVAPGPAAPLADPAAAAAARLATDSHGRPTATALKATVRELFPEVARTGLKPGEYLVVVVSPEGEVVRHAWVRGPADPGLPGATGGLADRRVFAVLREFRGRIDRTAALRTVAGELGPTAAEVDWVRLRAPVAAGAPPTPLQRAMARHYTPEMRRAGLSGTVSLSFAVGADGRARTGEVVGEADPRLAGAARAVVADLTWPPNGVGEETMATLVFSPETIRQMAR